MSYHLTPNHEIAINIPDFDMIQLALSDQSTSVNVSEKDKVDLGALRKFTFLGNGSFRPSFSTRSSVQPNLLAT